ncbi:MAG: hypothetical protein A2Z99_12780 [Treponema sp. GWB1_62_6]|nr:MAG: hypothetical protein A2Z99_12780 [Treponema sp. GWB1_62_6]
MAKKPAAVYEPGELDRVRQRLGSVDAQEAKRIASRLGGEVGIERVKQAAVHDKRTRSREELVDVSVGGRGEPSGGKPPRRHVELIADESPDRARAKAKERKSGSAEVSSKGAPGGAPSGEDEGGTPRPSYRERLRMDRYAAQPEFEIKNPGQTLYSMLSFFGDPPDLVNSAFATRRMNEYYHRLELLVASTRTLLPRHNRLREERLRAQFPFAYRVLDVIRQWNIELIASELARIQARPRDSVVADYADILRTFYLPLFLLERLDPETHVREAYRSLYKQLLLDNPVEAKEKFQGQVHAALAAYATIQRSVRFLLYPLLMKLLSERWLSYEDFFVRKRKTIRIFLKTTETARLAPPDPEEAARSAAEKEAAAAAAAEPDQDESAEPADAVGEGAETSSAEATGDAVAGGAAAGGAATGGAATGGAGQATAPAEGESRAKTPSRALERSLGALETLFPEAGWEKLVEFPDLYPYFAGVFEFKKGFELVAPTDPLQQIVVLMHVLEEIFYGLRYVAFGSIVSPVGDHERADVAIARIVGGWHEFIEAPLGKEYLPRLSEYCRVLDGSPEARVSTYAKRMLVELYWIKRLYFLPYFRFDNMMSAPPFRRQEIRPVFSVVRELRRLLTTVAAGIEAGSKAGGAAKGAHCDGIDNPWDPYVFQVPNPVSFRLDGLLGGKSSKRKTNAALVYYALSTVIALDSLMNDDAGWAYADPAPCLFRSVDGLGSKPIFGVDERVDADAVFRKSLKAKREAQDGKA